MDKMNQLQVYIYDCRWTDAFITVFYDTVVRFLHTLTLHISQHCFGITSQHTSFTPH